MIRFLSTKPPHPPSKFKNLKAAESSPHPPPHPKPCPSPPFHLLAPHVHPLKITGRPNMRTWSQFNHRNIGITRRISGIWQIGPWKRDALIWTSLDVWPVSRKWQHATNILTWTWIIVEIRRDIPTLFLFFAAVDQEVDHSATVAPRVKHVIVAFSYTLVQSRIEKAFIKEGLFLINGKVQYIHLIRWFYR